MPQAKTQAAALLAQADAEMRTAYRSQTATFKRDRIGYRVRFEYPGVLRVYVKATGELVAESQPGDPHMPAMPAEGMP